MKAIVMRAPGGPEVLEVADVPKPAIGSTHLLVRMIAAGLNPVDYKLRTRGSFAPKGEAVILGADGAGIVEAVGSDVTRFAPGDAVYFCDGGFGLTPGTYCEYRAVDERHAAHKPRSLSFEQAAAAPLVLITAWESLFERTSGVGPGARVLVHAGGGGVGHVAIQLAHDAGALVAATVSESKAELALSLGAVKTIDYRATDFVAETKAWTDGRGADVVFDTVGGETFAKSFHAVRPYGELVTCVESTWPSDGSAVAQRANLRVGFEWMPGPAVYGWEEAKRKQAVILQTGAELFDAGKLRIVVAETYPLDAIADAHRSLERGSTAGKIVVTIAAP